MMYNWSRTLCSILFTLEWFWSVSKGCTRIIVDSSEADDSLSWIDGTFEIDKNARVDDRMLYKEVNGTRVIYHYSGNAKEREVGRWLLGSAETMGTDNGWAYRTTWSISPDDANIQSLHNNDQHEFPWKVYENEEEWVDVTGLSFYCESAFGGHDAMNDFLFVTTNETFEDGALSYQNIHGFYIRISEDTFAKISGSKRVFYQEKGGVSEIFVVGDASKIQPNGLPVSPIPTTKLSKPALNATWHLHGSDGKVNDRVHIVVLQVNDHDEEEDEEEKETIYDLVRRYYRELKNDFIEEKEIAIAELNNGLIYPMIGLGTGGITGTQTHQIIKEAVTKHDYIGIDSASHYESEVAIGTVLKEDPTLRSRLFLTSKIWPTDLYFQASLDSVQKTLNSMKTNYVDLYMIYWPACYDHLKFVDCSHSKDGKWQQAYEALSKLYAEGVILNIGVSNWDEELMTQLLEAFPIKPQVVQNQMDLKTINWDFKDYLNDVEILLQAYSPYQGIAVEEDSEYREWKKILSDMCEEIEQDQGIKISPTQLALRFLYENNIAIIPKSTKSQHLKENNDIFIFEFTNDHNVGLGGRDVEKEEL